MRRCPIFAPSLTWTSWKWTVFDSVAENTLTGTNTAPKPTVPFQIERGMPLGLPGRLLSQEGGRRAPPVRRLPRRAERPALAAGARDAPDPRSARGRDRRARRALRLELPRQRRQRRGDRRAARRAAHRGGPRGMAVPQEPRRAADRVRDVRQSDVLVAAGSDGDA